MREHEERRRNERAKKRNRESFSFSTEELSFFFWDERESDVSSNLDRPERKKMMKLRHRVRPVRTTTRKRDMKFFMSVLETQSVHFRSSVGSGWRGKALLKNLWRREKEKEKESWRRVFSSSSSSLKKRFRFSCIIEKKARKVCNTNCGKERLF